MEIRVAALSQPAIAPWIPAFTETGVEESRIWAMTPKPDASCNMDLSLHLLVGAWITHEQWTFGGVGGAFWFVFKDLPAKVETLYFHFNLCLKFI